MVFKINRKRIFSFISILCLSGVGVFFQNCAEVASPESEFMITEDSRENVLCNVPNGQGERVWTDGVLGPCEVKFCNLNYKIDNNFCIFSASSCPINNGIGTTEAGGICRATSCNVNYSLYDNSCVVNRISCPFPNGTGEKTWNGNAYGNCLAKTCNPRFILYNQECQPVLTSNTYFPRTKTFNIERGASLDLAFVSSGPIPFNTNVAFRVTGITTPERLRAEQFISGGLVVGKIFNMTASRTATNFNLNIPINNTVRLTKPLNIEFAVTSSQSLFPIQVILNINPSPTDYVDVSYQTTADGFTYCLALSQEGELRYGSINCASGFSNDGSNLRLNTATGSVIKAFQGVPGSPTFFYNEVKTTGQEQLISKNQDTTTIFLSNFIIRRFMAGTSHAVLLLGDRTKFAITSKLSSNRLIYFNTPAGVGALLDIAMTHRNTENLFALGEDGRVHWLRYSLGQYRIYRTLSITNKITSLTGGLDHISMLTDNQQIHFINVNSGRMRNFTLPTHTYAIHKIVGAGSTINVWYRDSSIRYYSIGTTLEAPQTPLGTIKSSLMPTYSGRRYYNPVANSFSVLNFP